MNEDVIQQLKNLSKQVKTQQEEIVQKNKEIEINQDVDFKSALVGVQPIKDNNQVKREQPKGSIRRRSAVVEEDKGNLFYISQGATDEEAPKQFSKLGQGRKDIQKLQSGKLRVISTLDLHGYSQDEAQETLNEFIEYVQSFGVCGQVIHGSGLGSKGFSPILKNLVRRWLMAHPDVLAYSEVGHNDGSVLILVKRVYQPDPFSES